MLVVRISIRFYEELTEANTVNAANFLFVFCLGFILVSQKQNKKNKQTKTPNKKQNINMNDRFIFVIFSRHFYASGSVHCIKNDFISFI